MLKLYASESMKIKHKNVSRVVALIRNRVKQSSALLPPLLNMYTYIEKAISRCNKGNKEDFRGVKNMVRLLDHNVRVLVESYCDLRGNLFITWKRLFKYDMKMNEKKADMMVIEVCIAEMDSWLGDPSWEIGQGVQILGQHNGWKVHWRQTKIY